MIHECVHQAKVQQGCHGDMEPLEMLPPDLGACPRVMGGQGVSGKEKRAANVELPWAEEVMLGTAMGWVVGPRDQDTKTAKLQETFLGDGMRHTWSITEPTDIGIMVGMMEQPWRMAKI